MKMAQAEKSGADFDGVLAARHDTAFSVTNKFDPAWNAHYDFTDATNQKEILHVEGYALDGDQAVYSVGDIILSPWGSNQVVDVLTEDGCDTCIKSITVNPGYMLSLQRHRGRSEVWEVTSGTLSVILDGERHDVPAGQSLHIPKGAVHCMINASENPVTVRETQKGTCREADNIRLMDFNGRPTYPLTSETEHRSARLYSSIQAEHAARYGFDFLPHESWISENK